MLGDPASAKEVWFVLHGYRQLAARFIRRFGALPGVGRWRAVVAPEALSRFYIEEEVGPHGPESRVGASWMTRADRDHEIEDYVEYLDRVASAVLPGADSSPTAGRRPATESVVAAGPRVVVFGFSQGAETASRWVARGRVRPDELVLWGGGVAVDLEPQPAAEAFRRVAIVHVVGSDDRWGGNRAGESERQLGELGLAPRRIGYTGGHRIPPAVLREHWPEP